MCFLMGVSKMDGTIRIRTVAWFTTAVVLSVLCTLLVTQAWSATAAPGDADSTFVPTAGCRVVDTRPAPATIGSRTAPLGAGDIFEVTVHGANGDCTGPLAIPTDAVAVALNVTAVNATARSNIRVYPADLVEVPLLSNLNVTAGAPPTPNKVDTKLSADGKVRVFNEFGSVNIFIDVVGYYTNATLKELSQRVVALEATQAGGVDPAVLGRIDALETTTATNTAGVAGLETAQPFAVSASATDLSFLTTTPTSYLNLQVAAPVDGHVTINYSTHILNTSDGAASICNVYTGAPPLLLSEGEPGVGYWEASLPSNEGSVSGTKQFDIAAGTTTYSLVCEESSGSGGVRGRAMTAIFTPAS